VFEAFLWMVQYPGSGLGLSMMIMPGIIIWYLNGKDIKAQFGLAEAPAA
jgi:hypothetical protein